MSEQLGGQPRTAFNGIFISSGVGVSFRFSEIRGVFWGSSGFASAKHSGDTVSSAQKTRIRHKMALPLFIFTPIHLLIDLLLRVFRQAFLTSQPPLKMRPQPACNATQTPTQKPFIPHIALEEEG